MDITMKLDEKVIHRDNQGLYQTFEIGFEITEKDIPEPSVRERTLALRLQIKKLIVNTKVKEGLISVEQGLEELKRYQG